MKNIVKLFGIIALVAVIGFSMAACGDDDSGGGGGGGSVTFTINGLTPNTSYYVAPGFNGGVATSDIKQVKSNATGSLTISYSSDDLHGWWGEEGNICYATDRDYVADNPSKKTYKMTSITYTLNAASDFVAPQQ